MKPLLAFAAFLSLSLHDICHIGVSNFNQPPGSSVQIFTGIHDFGPGQSLLVSSFGLQSSLNKNHIEKQGGRIVFREANLQSHTFRHQLIAHFNTAILQKLKKSRPVLTTTLNDM